MKKRLSWLVVVVALMGMPAQARAAEPPLDPGDSLATALGPVALDEPYRARLETATDLDVFRIDVPDGLSGLRVALAQTNTRCEVWGTLLAPTGTELNRVWAPRSGAGLVASSVAAGSYFLIVDRGEFVDCAGATYEVSFHIVAAELPGLLRSRAAPPAPRATASALFYCQTYCGAASRAGRLVRRVRDALAHARAKQRPRLRRRLKRYTRLYRVYRKRELHWCRRAGLT